MSGGPLLLKLEQHDRLSDEEKRVLENAISRIRVVEADEDIVHEGDHPSESNLLLDGFAARYKIFSNGRRQITAIHVPGDFVDLHSFLLRAMDHGVLALTPCRIAVVPHTMLERITAEHPHLTRLLWLNTLVDGAIHREWLTAMGRLSATAHMAHFICELFLRLNAVGRTDGDTIQLPLTQAELGDTLGLSTVHVNRVLQELRKEGLIRWQGDALTILDWERLKTVGEFTPTYLNLQHEDR
ncbi:Crp/Fnr family transcriptional regulator [Microvirga makkahensis]|uniref:Helix-turn-helix domain-containing protein n=1 Tax=Microvirga makkahensis TaxID=1128670 RepID=A0A7X3MRK3_9HYPH|nr:Crp/Fnr family transcriptional regulator [Microvirga makkahensis]MXQ11902.1 helix-turn-helix domain-containing protein [Microvirga makkahensis]